MSRPRRAGTRAPLNQVTQGLGMFTPSSEASFMHSRFCAAAVRNSAEECTLPWNCACTRNLPSLPALGFPAQQRPVLNKPANLLQDVSGP